ncbi:deoxynucleoside kinase [Methylophaga sp. OBS4]|jgi:deoxyadenosine/deoxycytidine kinase|uniref:deoxynucleoside kinase n=1 Tax=Methylophaga sp. OBS4 TaxID=2991935 RepID=UPI002255C497|nr:deoxynucleoside kinase [Methylophaga sp. OBS4]MCX4187853.1 deoxynucleoside kinase [Methylophaga sp. OBS4]
MNQTLAHRYIVVEGPIGVGKTHLVKRIADSFSGSLLLEQPEQNPFLEKFYLYPKQSALPTQLSFLMQRVKLSKTLNQDDLFNDLHIADFMVEKDKLFAQISLDDDELALYNMVYDNLTVHHRTPDLVIYLQASLPVLKARIAQRGISYEQHVEEAYLKRLADTYADFFHYYDASPLLIVNAEQIDLVNSEPDYQQLLEQICSIQSGRHYYNPLPVKEKK